MLSGTTSGKSEVDISTPVHAVATPLNTCRASRACRTCRDEHVALCCPTSATQHVATLSCAKIHEIACRVVAWRDAISGIWALLWYRIGTVDKVINKWIFLLCVDIRCDHYRFFVRDWHCVSGRSRWRGRTESSGCACRSATLANRSSCRRYVTFMRSCTQRIRALNCWRAEIEDAFLRSSNFNKREFRFVWNDVPKHCCYDYYY